MSYTQKIVVITGCSTRSSLGYRIAQELKKVGDFYIIGIANPNDYEENIENKLHLTNIDKVYQADLTYEYGDIISEISLNFKEIYCLINCAGMNSNSWFEDITEENWYNINNVNALSIIKIGQSLLPNIILAKGTILNIVSNASEKPMSCSLAYNASKAAAKMITRQMAHELTKKHNITIFSVSPNKLEGTEMTKSIDKEIQKTRGWTEEYSREYQDNSLLCGRTDPDTLAEFIAFILSKKERHIYLSGCDINYGD